MSVVSIIIALTSLLFGVNLVFLFILRAAQKSVSARIKALESAEIEMIRIHYELESQLPVRPVSLDLPLDMKSLN